MMVPSWVTLNPSLPEANTMRRIQVSAYFGPILITMFLISALIMPQTLHAQTAPAAGTTVAVRMIDTVNSGSDPAGRQYRASVTQAVDAGNGISIAPGAAATVTLTSSGSGYTAQLSSITINGNAVAVTSNSATVSAVAQSAQSKATSAVGSMLGGFGHHVSAPASVVAAATGQHVSLPTGTTLSFVLSQPPASGSAAPSAVATAGAPTPQPAAASGSAQGSEVTAFYCLTALTAQNIIYYSPVEHRGQASTQGEIENAFGAFLRKTYGIGVSTTCTEMSSSTPEADRQQKIDDYRTRYKVVETSWVYTPAGGPAGNTATASANTASAGVGPALGPNQSYAFCYSSGYGESVVYFSDIFGASTPPPTGPGKGPVEHMGNAVPALQVPFQAFLQKKYGVKTSVFCFSNFNPTPTGLKAAQDQKKQTESNLVSRSRGLQIVETGWKGQ